MEGHFGWIPSSGTRQLQSARPAAGSRPFCRRVKLKWWLSIGCFLTGLAVGIVVTPMSRESRVTATRSPLVFSAPEPKALPAPPSPQSTTAAPALEPKPSYRDRLSTIAELNSLLRVKIAVPLLNFDEVNDDFVKVYGLRPGEVARLKANFAAAKNSLAIWEAKHATIEPSGENGYSISIPPFPQEGGLVYDGLLQSIHEVLGDERFAAYRASAGDMDSSGFGMFGLSKTTIDVRPSKEGERPTSTSSSSVDANGTMKFQVNTNPAFFAKQYPELYQKTVEAGLWKGTTRD